MSKYTEDVERRFLNLRRGITNVEMEKLKITSGVVYWSGRYQYEFTIFHKQIQTWQCTYVIFISISIFNKSVHWKVIINSGVSLAMNTSANHIQVSKYYSLLKGFLEKWKKLRQTRKNKRSLEIVCKK